MSQTLCGIIHASRDFFTQLTCRLVISITMAILRNDHFVPGQALISRIAVTAVEMGVFTPSVQENPFNV